MQLCAFPHGGCRATAARSAAVAEAEGPHGSKHERSRTMCPTARRSRSSRLTRTISAPSSPCSLRVDRPEANLAIRRGRPIRLLQPRGHLVPEARLFHRVQTRRTATPQGPSHLDHRSHETDKVVATVISTQTVTLPAGGTVGVSTRGRSSQIRRQIRRPRRAFPRRGEVCRMDLARHRWQGPRLRRQIRHGLPRQIRMEHTAAIVGGHRRRGNINAGRSAVIGLAGSITSRRRTTARYSLRPQPER